MHHKSMSTLKSRVRAAAIHLALSALIAAVAAAVVFLLWFPYPYREISGGRTLFFIVVAVDVILGPLITLAIFDMRKGWPVLRKDLIVVGLVQLIALGYGTWTVHAARPVHLVFEYDRFKVVHAIEVDVAQLEEAPSGLQNLPLAGPTLVALKVLSDSDRSKYMLADVTSGSEIAWQPALWEPYEKATERVLKAARPLEDLMARKPEAKAELARLAQTSSLQPSEIVTLPVVGREQFWTVLLDRKTARPVAFLPLDPF